MLQRNETGYAQTVTQAVPTPGLPVSVDIQPGQCADLPDLLFGWVEDHDGTPVVTISPDIDCLSLPWRESAFVVEPTDAAPEPTEPTAPPAPPRRKNHTNDDAQGA